MAATKRNVPARRTATPVKATPTRRKEPEMFEVISDVDEDGYVDVKIFGEKFTIDTDINGWGLMLAGAGGTRNMVKLVHGIIKVTPNNGENIEVARMRERDRFDDLLWAQRDFTIEKAMELVNALTEVSAGNEL